MATTPKHGWPPGREYLAVVTTRITPAQLKQLDKWARKHKTTRAAALRQAVDELVYTVPVRGTTARGPAGPSGLGAKAQSSHQAQVSLGRRLSPMPDSPIT